MKLDYLKQERKEAKARVKKFNYRCQSITSLLCKARGEYLEAKDEFEELDREIAEYYVQVIEPTEEPKKEKGGKKKEESDPLDLDKLTNEQMDLLKARLENELEKQEKEKEEGS